jgi:hypothetical protein
MLFLRKISNRKKGKKETMEVKFEEITASIIVATCVLPCTGMRIYIKIHLSYQDESIWKYLKEILLFSNTTDYHLMYRLPILYEVTPFLWQIQKTVIITVSTFFFTFARVLENTSILDILKNGVNVSITEVFLSMSSNSHPNICLITHFIVFYMTSPPYEDQDSH